MRLSAGTPERIAQAIADGDHVEWTALPGAGRANSADSAVVEQLGTLAAIAASNHAGAERRTLKLGRHTLDAAPRAIAAVAAARVIVAVACLVLLAAQARGWPAAVAPVHALIVFAFAGGGMILLRRNRADGRAAELGVVFLLVATSFANGLAGAIPASVPLLVPILASTPVDCFIPYAFWRFAGRFPLGSDLTTGVRASLAAGVALLIATAASVWLKGFAVAEWVQPLARRSAKGTVYWTVVFGLLVPAILTVAARTWRAGPEARRRGWVFLTGLTLGLLPLSLNIVLETASGSYRRFSAAHRAEVVTTALVFLLTIPFTTTYAVLIDKVLDVRVLIRRTLQYALARTTLAAATLVPFGLAVLRVYSNRRLPVEVVFGSGRILGTLSLAAAGLLLLRIRVPLQRALDKAFFRSAYDADAAVAAVLDEARSSRGLAEMAAAVIERITDTLQLHSAALMVMDESGCLASAAGAAAPLDRQSALVALASASGVPLYVDLHANRGPIRRLPDQDLFWLADHDVRALVPIHGAEGSLVGVLVMSAARSDELLDQAHGPFITAVAAGLAGPLERRLESGEHRASNLADAGVMRAVECEPCGLVLPHSTSACPACSAATQLSPVPLIVAGKFRLQRRLGRGGMGVVFQAVDLGLDRFVAIKTLPTVTPDGAVRLRREGRTMATLSHPNLATVFGVETWRGTPMLVVEHLAGGTLAQRLRRGPLDAAECVATMRGVLAGVAHAHAQGVLHRDLKPSNIGFTADGRPKVLDFGLARLSEAAAWPAEPAAQMAGGASAVLTDRRVGTAMYMAPEAVRGETPGPGFDLWSAAIVMVEALSGRLPFASSAAALSSLERGRLPDWRAWLEAQPDALARTLAAALDADPARRPASAAEFLDRLTGL